MSITSEEGDWFIVYDLAIFFFSRTTSGVSWKVFQHVVHSRTWHVSHLITIIPRISFPSLPLAHRCNWHLPLSLLITGLCLILGFNLSHIEPVSGCSDASFILLAFPCSFATDLFLPQPCFPTAATPPLLSSSGSNLRLVQLRTLVLLVLWLLLEYSVTVVCSSLCTLLLICATAALFLVFHPG